MAPLLYQYIYTVDENDISPDYRHVHHARTLLFLERARCQFLDEINCSNASLIKQGVFSVVTRIEIEYRREVVAGEIRVTCENLEVRGRSLFVTQRVYNHRGKEAIYAVLELKFMDGQTRRAGEVPQRIAAVADRAAFC